MRCCSHVVSKRVAGVRPPTRSTPSGCRRMAIRRTSRTTTPTTPHRRRHTRPHERATFRSNIVRHKVLPSRRAACSISLSLSLTRAFRSRIFSFGSRASRATTKIRHAMLHSTAIWSRHIVARTHRQSDYYRIRGGFHCARVREGSDGTNETRDSADDELFACAGLSASCGGCGCVPACVPSVRE